MEPVAAIISIINNAVNRLSYIGFADVVDILIIAYLIYKLMGFLSKTKLSRAAKGILLILIVLFVSGHLGLNVVNFLLRGTVEIGLLALIIIFQPELRRILEKVGSGTWASLLSGNRRNYNLDAAITQTTIACSELAKNKIGALIVFERDNRLNEQINTGTLVDADPTAELIKNIFFPKAPLHDGAVIIRNGRIAAAGCMLPLSANRNLSRDLGMRHRAAIGMSEHSDAVVAVVSEETGSIAVAAEGMLKRHLSPETVEKLLKIELMPENGDPGARGLGALIQKVRNNGKRSSDE
jgi:diadenylate cyclase